jgi:hypothetical protein
VSTVPASSDKRDSAVFVSAPSRLVLMAIEQLGLSVADAIALETARRAETVRLAAFEVSL